MNTFEINHQALNELSKQNWMEAQRLFFDNAKKNPTHETYNNLGYYLCTEGLECSNGKTRNAELLGMKYLLKAANISTSVRNLSAIATAIDLRLKYCNHKKIEEVYTYQNAYKALDKAVKMRYSHEIEYNRLRFLYLSDMQSQTVLDDIRTLITNFQCEESITFYLYVLCIHHHFEECIQSIKKYQSYIDRADYMILNCLCGEYEQGINCLQDVCRNTSLGELDSAVIIESLIKLGRFKQAKLYADHVIEYESGIKYHGKDHWYIRVFDDLVRSTDYRRKLISQYRYNPVYLTPCCYFGCEKHGNPDSNN